MEAYIEQQGLERYRGRIMPRNSHRSPWLSVLDLRFAQELPIFRKTRGILTFDVENFANMLNSDWGQLRQVSFPYVAPVVDVNRIATTGCPNGAASCYVYRPRSGSDRAGGAVQDDLDAAVGLARPARLPHRVLMSEAQCADAVLMIRPARFGANPETAASNRFQQSGATAGDAAAALREFDGLVDRLRAAGVEVHVAEDTPEPREARRLLPEQLGELPCRRQPSCSIR